MSTTRRNVAVSPKRFPNATGCPAASIAWSDGTSKKPPDEMSSDRSSSSASTELRIGDDLFGLGSSLPDLPLMTGHQSHGDEQGAVLHASRDARRSLWARKPAEFLVSVARRRIATSTNARGDHCRPSTRMDRGKRGSLPGAINQEDTTGKGCETRGRRKAGKKAKKEQ